MIFSRFWALFSIRPQLLNVWHNFDNILVEKYKFIVGLSHAMSNVAMIYQISRFFGGANFFKYSVEAQ